MSEFDQDVFTKQFTAGVGAAIAQAMKPVYDQMALAQKATAPGPSTWNLIHGRGSLFGQVAVGLDNEVISTMQHWEGITELLPIRGVRTYEVLLPFITGVDVTSTTEPTNECDDCISGETESCIQHFPLGRVCRETQTMTPDRIIERLNNGDIDLTLMNDILGNESPWHPGDSFGSMSGAQLMQVATAWALLFELPPLFMANLAPVTWTGNPVNNQADGYREFRGLQLLVNTGFVDTFTNTTCPALDSDLKNFNYGDVETTTYPSAFEVLEMAEYFVHRKARTQRLAPVQHVVVMRPELWQVLSGLIPPQAIQAALMRATTTMPARYTVNIDGASVVAERNRMRADSAISLNGRILPVVLDDGLPEQNNAINANLEAGEFSSDVYILPLRYLGNREAMRIEYKDFRYLRGEVAATDGLIGDFYKPSADGRFAYTWVKNGWCFKIQAKIEPRIILKTPQLAARIQNIKYVPTQHLSSPDPTSPYFQKGGVSTRTWPSSYYYSR